MTEKGREANRIDTQYAILCAETAKAVQNGM